MNSGVMSLPVQSDEYREIAAALGDMGLIADDERMTLTSLSGGVSCDVYRVEIAGHATLVVKRALPKLRVNVDWRAPPERSNAEVAWINLVAGINPLWVPKILGVDRKRHLFTMEFFPPDHFPIWKSELAAGRVDIDFATSVGSALSSIHAATAGRAGVEVSFANDAQFRALRLEPYLLFTAERHPDLAQAIRQVAGGIARSRIALMQGDISPKNILCGPLGPVFLDAETACYGDPAFDLAFMLNHLLLKGIHAPTLAPFSGSAGVATTTPTFPNFPLGVTSGTYDQTLDLLSLSSYNPAFVAAHGGTAAGAEAALVAALDEGRSYLNIHTHRFPGGEISGYLSPVSLPDTTGTVLLLGSTLFAIFCFKGWSGSPHSALKSNGQ
jgi:aminoglycoside phosphotransferase (APT) family kinase protein